MGRAARADLLPRAPGQSGHPRKLSAAVTRRGQFDVSRNDACHCHVLDRVPCLSCDSLGSP